MNIGKIVQPFLKAAATATAWIVVLLITIGQFKGSDSGEVFDLSKIGDAFGSVVSDGWYYALLSAIVWTLLQSGASKKATPKQDPHAKNQKRGFHDDE